MSVRRPAAVVVLAAGEGTRMKSATPKVLHEMCGRSMLGHVLAAAAEVCPEQVVVVVGHRSEQVSAHVAGPVADHMAGSGVAVRTLVQRRQGGTGHAVRTVAEAGLLPAGTVVVACGDTPLLTGDTLAGLLAEHERAGNAVTLASAEVAEPRGYGRVLRDSSGACAGIVEDRDATAEQRRITEINAGLYVFDGALLADAVKRVSADNAKAEEYLTDVPAILLADGHRVGAWRVADPVEVRGVNDQAQLALARRALNDRLLTRLMRAGVVVVDPATTWVDVEVDVHPDAVLLPDTMLEGRTTVASGARVGPGCVLRDTTVGAGAVVRTAVCEGAEIGPRAAVGPFAYLRPGTRLGPDAKAGTYVETKNAVIGAGSKVPHLTYVGDAEIGVGSNIGASSVFVNYDGVAKHRTRIGDHVRIGSDNMLVAPVSVGDGAYTGAGTVVRRDVPPGALAVSGGPQRILEGWVESRRPDTPAAAAARRARDADQRPAGDAPGPGEGGAVPPSGGPGGDPDPDPDHGNG